MGVGNYSLFKLSIIGYTLKNNIMQRMPRKGDIARCSRKMLGLITSDTQKDVTYPDGNTEKAWVGIHIHPDRAGQKWSSKNPTVIAHIFTDNDTDTDILSVDIAHLK
jgi:hypothetical protein